MASTSLFAQSTAASTKERNSPVDLASLQNASKVLHDQLSKDAQSVPEISEVLNAQGVQASSAYSIFPDDLRVPFQKRRHIGIPEALFQHYTTTDVKCNMGLLPEIERVWISINHKLFLWDYLSDNQEISSFVDQPSVISHVALVKPKKGLFIDEISHLLVICTPQSVVLIALSLSPNAGSSSRPSKEVKLYATDLTVPLQQEMISVAGTSDGRIFLCGADGNLYELHYQENESWFGKRVQMINHSVGGVSSLIPRFAISNVEDRVLSVIADPDRDYLYTLSGKNIISVYKPTTEKTVQHIQTLSSLYKATQEKCPASPAINPQTFQIVSLHPVAPSARNTIHLVAITTNGVRLYFSPSSSYSYGISSQSRSLQLTHVRLPPSNLIHPDEQEHPSRPSQPPIYGAPQGHTPNQSRPYVLSNIENACYIDGLTLAAQVGDVETVDYLLCMSPDLTRFGSFEQLNLPPSAATQAYYPGQTGGNKPPLTEYATLLSIQGRTWAIAPVVQPPRDEVSPAVATINELATQSGESPRQVMVLTNSGVSILVKRRALDYLKAVLEEYQNESNSQPMSEFLNSFGRTQSCAMLLCLASGNTFLDVSDQSHSSIASLKPELAVTAKQAFYECGERPVWSERTVFGRSDHVGTAIYSGRRDGLALYFARLVRPIWKSKLTTIGPSGLSQSAVSDDSLVIIQKNLYALKDLLDKNPHLFHSSPGDSTAARTATLEQEAWKAEHASVSELLSLLTRTVEALSFVLLLNDYKFGDILNRCDADVQKIVTSLTFEDLITTQNGLTASRALVNVIIDQQIGQQISAKENIRKAAETSNPAERQNWLAESLRLYIKGARILDLEKLREVEGDFQLLRYAKGAVELPLICAKVFDQDNNGLNYWHSGATSGGDVHRKCYEQRMRCYELILDSLSVFEGQTDQPAPPTSLPSEGIAAVQSHAYELAFASEDEMFHSVLYDWLIGRQLADDLLEIRPPFLEAHLRREPVSPEKYQLLWQFYVKDGQPLRAAEVLSTLAESDQFDLNLDARLEYLTLAVGNAKSHPVSTGGRHETAIAFLTDLEEKLEVAQVQLEIYNTLLPHVNDAPEVGARISALSKRLFTMSELYQEYALPFDLPVLKLLCLHVSEHRDEAIVKQIWNQIFEHIAEENSDPLAQAEQIVPTVVPLGQRFYPSESAFPLRIVADLLVRFSLERKERLPFGWAPRILVQCGVPFGEIWDVLHEMYESHIPPFNAQANVQAISSDIAVLLSDWLEEAKRPNSSIGRGEFPVSRIDFAIDQYISELHPDRRETKATYEGVKRQLRRNW
ncbi:hypothetical protein D9758_000357 [Tetrapyrgos nigripes]|uniref:Nucleoporin n=1 Tax=Tetrapyrgos nigripes TaxID=182062 RepID=A0A8H5H111_9AGAR|nr:hypothetical protein D9758_000357 [Tetrapyrgos nigripes]